MIESFFYLTMVKLKCNIRVILLKVSLNKILLTYIQIYAPTTLLPFHIACESIKMNIHIKSMNSKFVQKKDIRLKKNA